MNQKGFTLIELMITLAVSGIILSAVIAMLISSSKNTTIQHQNIKMQQNGRAAVNFIANELLMAGYDPTRSADSGITSIGLQSISYTCDLNCSGGIETDEPNWPETVNIGFNTATNELTISYGNGQSFPILDNVVDFAILYAFDYHSQGAEEYGILEENSSNQKMWSFGQSTNYYTFGIGRDEILQQAPAGNTDLPSAVDPEDIRAIKIMLLTRERTTKKVSFGPDPLRTDLDMPAPDGTVSLTQNLSDEFIYKRIVKTVKLRNMYF